jgi:hypothetical protein
MKIKSIEIELIIDIFVKPSKNGVVFEIKISHSKTHQISNKSNQIYTKVNYYKDLMTKSKLFTLL